MAALKPYDARLRRQAVAPLLEEEIDFPSAEISLGALLRWCCLAIFPCYDVPDFRRQQKIRSDLSVGKPSYPIIRRWCQSRRHRCCWLCCAAVGPLIAVVLTALYIFYTAYLPAVSRQHPALYDTNGSKIDAHGGQMIMHDGVVYWYGESQKSLSARGYPVGVNQGWTNEGVRAHTANCSTQDGTRARLRCLQPAVLDRLIPSHSRLPELITHSSGCPLMPYQVNCYMSRDMLSWESAGMVFRNTSIVLPHNQPGPYVIERPKVVYNNLTRMFVMWMHVDSFSYGYTYAGVATSSSPLGPFVWKHAIRPNGYKSYDIQIW